MLFVAIWFAILFYFWAALWSGAIMYYNSPENLKPITIYAGCIVLGLSWPFVLPTLFADIAKHGYPGGRWKE